MLYSLAIAFNRVVPERLFRCRRFVIYELADKTSHQSETSSTDVRWCEMEQDFEAVSHVTYVDPKLLPVGVTAIVANIDNQVAGGIWCQAGSDFPENELGVGIALNQDQAWLFGARVDTDFRRRGVYGEILAFAIPSLAQSGVKEILVAVNPDNKASNRIHQRWSNRTVGKVFAARFLATVFCWSWGNARCDKHFALNCRTNRINVLIGE